MINEELLKQFHYEFKYWIPVFKSDPVELIAHEDRSADYETEMFHIFKLENGKYATVHEAGCSCYSVDEAEIDILPTEELAMEQFIKWQKDNSRG